MGRSEAAWYWASHAPSAVLYTEPLHRTRSRLRVCWSVALYLASGVILSIAFAWGPTFWLDFRGQYNTPTNAEFYEAHSPSGRDFRVTRYGGWWWDQWNLDPIVFDLGLSTLDAPAKPAPPGVPPAWVPWPEDKGSAWVTGVGWPCRVFRSTESVAPGSGIAWHGSVNKDLIVLNLFGKHSLPAHVLWRGLLVDSLLFAVAACLAVEGPVALNRVRRRRKGLCAACGYDMKGTAGVCPECGAGSRNQRAEAAIS